MGTNVVRNQQFRALVATAALALAVLANLFNLLNLVAPPSPVHAADAPSSASELASIRPVHSDDTPVIDDVALAEMLGDAIELRVREDYDRMLDARDPGELIEHATLTDTDFEYRKIGIDTLFIVGDELFAYLFRPENGWGGKERRADDTSYTPSPRRIHDGDAGGPDAFACANCHSKGGPDGSGTQTQNAFLRGNGHSTSGADQRNPPHVLGLGAVEILGREMTAELRAQATVARKKARKEKHDIEQPLTAKGVSFGKITVKRDRSIDYAALEGVDEDLVVKPFGWKGHQAYLRGMIEESLHIHQGLVSKRIHLAVKDGKLDAAPYGKGPWYDLDEDGVSLELDSGMLTTVVGYLAQLEVPITRPPRDPGLIDMFAEGSARFDSIGCAGCHVRSLDIDDPKLNAADGAETSTTPFIIDVAKDGDGPKVEPRYVSPTAPHIVHLFSDLKRHDMGEELATPAAQGSIPAREFLTRPLWGLAETAPYLHDGRAPTIHEAILYHGGEAAAARDAYLALDERQRASLRVFLTSLSRQPKLFVP